MGSYPTDANPTVAQWLDYNQPMFKWLRSGHVTPPPASGYVSLVDVDDHARKAGMGTQEYFDELVAYVGDLGKVRLKLSHSYMDEAFHVILVEKAG
ncbi:hypothetical protein IPM09_02180 [Candidatus Saccharibacteria bacterium]|nr:MAG: hypothetical protein IPM09_02180 [Candidatus Saccharibacteria bacterium]